ncbi:hypothetical protein YQE_07844, partial [Dendroctonus ponderosae]
MQKQEEKSRMVYRLVLTGGPCGGKTTGQARLSTFFENLGWKVRAQPGASRPLSTVCCLAGVPGAGDRLGAAQWRHQVHRSERGRGRDLPGEPAQDDAAGGGDVLRAGAHLQAQLLDHLRPRRHGRLRLEQHRAARQPLQPDHPHGVGGERRRRLLQHRGPLLSVGGRGAGARAGQQGGRRLDRPPLLRRDRQQHRLRGQDQAHDWLGLPQDRPGHGRPPADQLEEAQVPGGGPHAGRRPLPALPGLRGGAQLPAVELAEPSAAAEARPEGVLQLHPHGAPPEPAGRPGDRGEDADQPSRLHQLADAEGQLALHHLQEAALLHLRQPVLPAGHLRAAECRGLILLETYSTLDDARLQRKLPTFLTIEREVTGSADYSMYNLSLREDWKTSKKYLRTNFVGPEDAEGHGPNQLKLKLNGHGAAPGLAVNGAA